MNQLVAVTIGMGAMACAPDPDSFEKIPDGSENFPVKDAGAAPRGQRDAGRVDAGRVRPAADGGGHGISHDGGVDGGERQRPETPAGPAATRWMDAPCAFPASLSYENASNTLLMACGGAQNALFRSPPIGSANAGPWGIVGIANGYPSNHLQLSDRYYLVNHSMPDGFTIIDGDTGEASSSVDFSQLSIMDSDGNDLGFTPNNPAGAVLTGAKICVATANMNHMDMDPANTTFFIGTVLCFPYNGNGVVDPSGATAYYTTGANPTGMALVDEEPEGNGTQRFAVLSSNNYAPAPGEPAAIDIFESPAMTKTPIFLGSITAQISPTLAVARLAEDAILYGIQKPAPQLKGVFVDSGVLALEAELDAVENFISSVQISGSVAAVSDFGVFGEGGRILFVNLGTGWIGRPETPLDGAAGPSVVVDGKLFQAVTDNSGTGASIERIDLSTLE